MEQLNGLVIRSLPAAFKVLGLNPGWGPKIDSHQQKLGILLIAYNIKRIAKGRSLLGWVLGAELDEL